MDYAAQQSWFLKIYPSLKVDLPTFNLTLNEELVEVKARIEPGFSRLENDIKPFSKTIVEIGGNVKLNTENVLEFFKRSKKIANSSEETLLSKQYCLFSEIGQKTPLYEININFLGAKINPKEDFYKDFLQNKKPNNYDELENFLKKGRSQQILKDIISLHEGEEISSSVLDYFKNPANSEGAIYSSNESKFWYRVKANKTRTKITGISNVYDHKQLYNFFNKIVTDILVGFNRI